jgi:hypothetical protein
MYVPVEIQANTYSCTYLYSGRYTRNETFLKKVSYPFLRAVAAWWSCWLVKQPWAGSHMYNDLTDCTYENCMWCGTWANKSGCFNRNDINSAVALSFSRFILRHLIDVSKEGLVSPTDAELAEWRDIYGHLSPLPRGWVKCHDNGGVASDPPHAPFSRNFTRPCESVNATVPSVVGSNYTIEVFLPQKSPFFFTTRYNPLEFCESVQSQFQNNNPPPQHIC